jgi:hypothetical protein
MLPDIKPQRNCCVCAVMNDLANRHGPSVVCAARKCVRALLVLDGAAASE